MKENCHVSLIVLVILCKVRPDACDVTNAAIIDECFKAYGAVNFVVLFNRAPNPKWNTEKA